MKVLLVGTGGVGEAFAVIAKERPFLEKVVLADLDLSRALEVAQKVGGGRRFPVERIDASSKAQIVALARKHEVDLVLNAVEPRFDMPIFDAAFEAGVHYMDMAMSLSRRHDVEPYAKTGLMLGDEQFAKADAWEERDLLALVGMGVEPGMATSSPRTRPSTCSTRSTRSGSATARTSRCRAIGSRRTSPSGPRSRSA
jgi:saccharopine dehydrogenase-like NADP-dependent oxidoreductase